MISAVILAGGLGTRLRDVVPDVPKPMAVVAGRPFLEHQLDYWIGQKVDRFILSVGYRHEYIIRHFGPRYRDRELVYVIEENPLGTGGGLLAAVTEGRLTESFLLLNGDTYFEADWMTLKKVSEAHNADWCFALFSTDAEGRYMGMKVSAEGKILSLKSEASGGWRLANGGVYWVRPQVLTKFNFHPREKVSLEEEILPALFSAGGRFFGVEFSGTFIDIGVPDDYRRASSLLTN